MTTLQTTSEEITLRDYFACQAMSHRIANADLRNAQAKDWYQKVADSAYRQADAMIEARRTK
jgi:hypothetical protein